LQDRILDLYSDEVFFSVEVFSSRIRFQISSASDFRAEGNLKYSTSCPHAFLLPLNQTKSCPVTSSILSEQHYRGRRAQRGSYFLPKIYPVVNITKLNAPNAISILSVLIHTATILIILVAHMVEIQVYMLSYSLLGLLVDSVVLLIPVVSAYKIGSTSPITRPQFIRRSGSAT